MRRCPACNTEMETWSEPDQDGHVFTFSLCPHCSLEIGTEDEPLPKRGRGSRNPNPTCTNCEYRFHCEFDPQKPDYCPLRKKE